MISATLPAGQASRASGHSRKHPGGRLRGRVRSGPRGYASRPKSRRRLGGPARWLVLAGVLLLLGVGAAFLNLSHNSGPPSAALAFDGNRAFGDLKALCDLGPRAPGSPGHRAAALYLKEQLSRLGYAPISQPFTPPGGRWRMENILVKVPGAKVGPVLLGAHWDTRPVADQDPDPLKQGSPILGANDGASGTAVLLEVARVLAGRSGRDTAPAVLVFFDGEDTGLTPDEMFLGAREFSRGAGSWGFTGAVVVDMVGDKDLAVLREGYSRSRFPRWEERVFSVAHALQPQQFPARDGPWMLDDHISLMDAGIPTDLLIDFTYPYWHTQADTPDKCSPGSLQATGKVLLALLESLVSHPLKPEK